MRVDWIHRPIRTHTARDVIVGASVISSSLIRAHDYWNDSGGANETFVLLRKWLFCEHFQLFLPLEPHQRDIILHYACYFMAG